MKTQLPIITFCFVIAASAYANDKPVDFENDLIPLFTKNGCNAGACHGAAIGRGGFKLSLYGGDPRSDYRAVVRQLEGRRVNLAAPGQSLIVLKPTEHVEHGGGTVFDYESESAQLLINWIRQGAKEESRLRLTNVLIEPKKSVTKLGEPIELKAVAKYSDGTSRDVTRWTIFKAEDSSAVEIDAGSGRSRVLRRGRHVVVARFLNAVVPIELVVPLTERTADLADEPQVSFIDESVVATLETLGLPVSARADASTFLRRVSLDLTGRLPSPETVRVHLQKDTQENVRAALVDELLRSDEFTEYWTLQLAKLLRVRPRGNEREGAYAYHEWLAEQVAADASYKKLAQALITSSGDSTTNGPVNFYRTVGNAREQSEFVSELFMGSRLRCANCHNHPLDRWTQDDYHGLAAIFAKVESGQIVKLKADGEVIHPRTLEPAIQRIPGEQFLAEDAADGREQLADWLTSDDNPYFAKAIVNRLWKRMMGRGLVEPADDFRATNPSTHPELLNKLAADFIANEYSLRHTLGLIARSETYARSADATLANKDDDRFYSHAARRPLEPEVLADAISDVLGVAEEYGSEPVGTRAVALVDPTARSKTLDILGRCGREQSCENAADAVGGLPRKLHLLNGGLLNARIGADTGRLAQLIAQDKQPLEIIEEFYVAALSRRPSAQERRHWDQKLVSLTTAKARQEFFEDFVWGLMTCDEFVTNH